MRLAFTFVALAAFAAGCGPSGEVDGATVAPDLATAEARYAKAREVDLAKPLMLVPGVPMCADLAQVEAYFSGRAHTCVPARDPAAVAVTGNDQVAGEAVYQVRAPHPSGEGSGVFWLPKDGVTNDFAELKAAFDALNDANGGQIAP